MAIDASIPLGVKTDHNVGGGIMAGVEGGMKLASLAQQIEASKQSVEASKANQALVETQTPGAAADSEVKQRALRFNAWSQENAGKFRKPDGSVDTLGAVEAAKLAGFGNEAQSIAISDLQLEANRIKNATDEQTRAHAQSNFMVKGIAHTASQIDGLTEDEAGAMLAKSAALQDKLVPGMGEQMTNVLTKVVPVLDAAGKPVIGPDGQPQVKRVVDQNAIKGAKTASMSALEQNDLALRKQQQAANLERYGQSPEAYSAASSLSTMARQALAKQGIDVAPTANYRDLYQLYGDKLSSLATNDVVSQEYRLGVKEKAAAAQTDISNINAIEQAARSYGEALMGTRVGTIGSDVWNKWVKTNPQLSALSTGVQAYNMRFPDDKIDTSKLTVGEIIAKLGQWKITRQNDLVTNLSNMGPNINTGTGENAPNVPQVAPPAGAPSAGAGVVPPVAKPAGTVLMKSPSNGKVYQVPASSVAEAKKNGYIIVTK
jgi:hypothetical protein